ncbi:MAG: TIR domain-containing protein, partial [Gammaproteobacteria bacterium]|nr:TIR domain-containing protein [Gammaproteobacteria bacterium]
ASQDAQAALIICTALRGAGIEVWLDQSELRGGDVWDQRIRQQIRDCALFVPIISRHTQQRLEGYFRLEWKLAVDRSHLMARERPFLVPVVLDDTRDQEALVPEAFRALQWTRLPEGATPPAFVERVRRLLEPGPVSGIVTPPPAHTASGTAVGAAARPRASPLRGALPALVVAAVLVAVLAALAYLVAGRFGLSGHGAPPSVAPRNVPRTSGAGSGAEAFAPPAHSIAVLPFLNMSGDANQEYFSDGLTEELLNSLSRIAELQVAARTSAFAFKGKDVDIGTIARRLNVATVLEGSVRRSAHTVRITVQLINAVTGFHLWSETYDRDLGDVLRLESDIATAVASALKLRLLGDLTWRIAVGGTQSAAAFDAYLRGTARFSTFHLAQDVEAAIDAYTEAIRIDPGYVLAYADRARAWVTYAGQFARAPAVRADFGRALADARRAIELGPDLADSHFALASYYESGALDFTQAAQAYDRAIALEPGNARLLRSYAAFTAYMGRSDAGLAAARRAVALDPLNRGSQGVLADALYCARRYEQSAAAYAEVQRLDPGSPDAAASRGLAYYSLGDFERARGLCEANTAEWVTQPCLAVSYEKLGRHAQARAVLAKLKASAGDTLAYQYAEVQAQWGDTAGALAWLEKALRVRDPGLEYLKTDPLLDPLRREGRFQAIERALRFPP